MDGLRTVGLQSFAQVSCRVRFSVRFDDAFRSGRSLELASVCIACLHFHPTFLTQPEYYGDNVPILFQPSVSEASSTARPLSVEAEQFEIAQTSDPYERRRIRQKFAKRRDG